MDGVRTAVEEENAANENHSLVDYDYDYDYTTNNDF